MAHNASTHMLPVTRHITHWQWQVHSPCKFFFFTFSLRLFLMSFFFRCAKVYCTCDACHYDPQQVITTRWGLSPPFHHPQWPPTSLYDLLGALLPIPPATPATTTPNESLWLIGGSHPPSTLSANGYNPQWVIMTHWGLSSPSHPQRWQQRPPTSHYNSLGAFLSLPPPITNPNESLQLIGGFPLPSTTDTQWVITTCWGLPLCIHPVN